MLAVCVYFYDYFPTPNIVPLLLLLCRHLQELRCASQHYLITSPSITTCTHTVFLQSHIIMHTHTTYSTANARIISFKPADISERKVQHMIFFTFWFDKN